MLAKSQMDWFTLNAVLFLILSQHKKNNTRDQSLCVRLADAEPSSTENKLPGP